MRFRLRRDSKWERKNERKVKEKTVVYSSDLYLACLFFLSMAEQRIYVDNIKSFSTHLRSRKSFQRCSHNKGVPVPRKPNTPIYPPLCPRSFPAMYVNPHICSPWEGNRFFFLLDNIFFFFFSSQATYWEYNPWIDLSLGVRLYHPIAGLVYLPKGKALRSSGSNRAGFHSISLPLGISYSIITP